LDTSASWIESLAGDADDELLGRLRRRDSAAFEQLFLRYYRRVYRVLYGVVTDAQEAEDLTQETFLALYRNPPGLEPSTSLAAWLYRVAVNRGYNALRGERRARRRLEEAAEAPAQVDPHVEFLRSEERERVRSALTSLPERTAKLLLLRYGGLSYAEIAAVMQVSSGSVGTLLVRAERAFVSSYEHITREERKA
jgi:RNA polymerase sigma-70 factor (ECF subfamily)